MTDAPDSEQYGVPPLVSSVTLAWQGVQVEEYHLGPLDLPAHHHAHHLLLLYQSDEPTTIRRKNAPRTEEARFRAGDLSLLPSGEYGPVAGTVAVRTIHLRIDDAHLAHVARQGLDLGQVRLRDEFHFEDPFLTQLGRQLLAAAGSQHALGLLYVESLTNTLCHQLIEHHADYQQRLPHGRALTGAVLARIDAYLEAAAEEAITLETLAGLANLSVFHFARLFKAVRGMSPYQYVLSWKIRRAQELLRAGDLPLAAISDALGFASPASFTAAFKRAVGRSPREFQRG